VGRSAFRPLTVLAGALLLAATSARSAFPAASASGTWLRYALPGAEVLALVADRSAPGAFWLGTAQGGLYRSTDGGHSWAPPSPVAHFPGTAVTALAPDPVRPDTLWIGLTGVVRGGRLLVTEDLGATFTEVRRWGERAGARSVAVASVSGRRVVVAAGDAGVEVSEDGGATWRHATPPLDPGAGISCIAFHPGRPGRLFAGTFRHPFRSDDLGRSWLRIAGGMVEDTEVFGIDFVPGNPDEFWAATCGWVYRTTDGGSSWVRHREGLSDRRTQVVRIDPRDPNRILAGTTGGLFESRDAGKSFRRITPEVVVNALVFDPGRPSRLVMGTESEGVLVSEDGGESFTSGSRGLAEARLSAVTATGNGRVLVARAADGPSGGLWAVDVATGSAERLPGAPPASVLALTDVRGRLLAATPEGIFTADAAGVSWVRTLARAARALTVDGPSVAAATDAGVFESRDAGRNWARVGKLSVPVETVRRVRGRSLHTSLLVAETERETLAWDGKSWLPLATPGLIGPLSGGFGRPRVARRPLPLGVEVDEARGLLFFRDAGGAEVPIALPESGLAVTGWAGDPREKRGLFLATIGRGLFRFVPAGADFGSR
jgi:photosystem II stability/assembly factor-like uncharacterized protein